MYSKDCIDMILHIDPLRLTAVDLDVLQIVVVKQYPTAPSQLKSASAVLESGLESGQTEIADWLCNCDGVHSKLLFSSTHGIQYTCLDDLMLLVAVMLQLLSKL